MAVFCASLSRASPERFRLSNSFASAGSAASGWPGPASLSSREAMFGSDDPELWKIEDLCQERVSRLQPFLELGAGVNRRVNLAADRLACRFQRRIDISVRQSIADDHQVNVAVCRVFLPCDGSIHEGS